MKAAIWTRYGPPEGLRLKEVEKPSPKDDEVLIRVHATTVTTGDCELRGFKPLSVFLIPMRLYIGLIRPARIKILGQELSGVIEAVGEDVTTFNEGDQVFAATGFRLGAHAEYTCLPEDGTVAVKPDNMSHEEAAAVPLGGLEAWHHLSKANIQSGERVLVNGAGGSIGTIAVQLAKHFGAEVTGVDSTGKLEMLRSIGADHVIDYTQEDFTNNGRRYDVIFDVIGNRSSSRCESSLTPNGRYLSANPGSLEQIRGLWTLITRREEVMREYTIRRNDALIALRALIEAGKIRTVIDRRYPLAQIAEAHRYVETGQKKGSVVITLA